LTTVCFIQKRREAERIEAEKTRVKEEALIQRQKESKAIHEQKKKWEDDLLAQKKKEQEAERLLQEKAEKEKLERLERIRNLDVESKKVLFILPFFLLSSPRQVNENPSQQLEEEYMKKNQESVATTGLTLEQVP